MPISATFDKTDTRNRNGTDLLPASRASMSLVKSVFRGEDGHEEAIHGATDRRDLEGRRSWRTGQGDLPEAQHLGRHLLHLAQEVPRDGGRGSQAPQLA